MLKDVLDLPLQHFFCAIWRLTSSGTFISSLTYASTPRTDMKATFLVIHPNIPKKSSFMGYGLIKKATYLATYLNIPKMTSKWIKSVEGTPCH